MALISSSSRAVPSPNPLIPAGSWAPFLSEHPRLLGSRQHLRDLAAKKPEMWREIRDLPLAQWQELTSHFINIGGHLATGIIHAIDGPPHAVAATAAQAGSTVSSPPNGAPDDRIRLFIDRSMAILSAGIPNQHQETWLHLDYLALTLDLFHDRLSPAQRQAIIDAMNGVLGVFLDDENAFHNSTLSKIRCYLRVAYGTWGDNPRAGQWRDYALVRLYENTVLPVLRELGAGGGFTECGWYCRHSLLHLAEALEMARRFEGYDGFAKAPAFFYHRMAYEMLHPYPALGEHACERFAHEGDGRYTYSEFMEYPRQFRTLLAQYFRGSPLARYVAARRRRGGSFTIRLHDFLYEEPADVPPGGELAVEPLPLETFPPAHMAAGIGKVFARGDWTRDATWLRFECGPYWNQHQHFEAGNFEIFRRDMLAAESGEYQGWDNLHAVNWQVRTIAHNCILIHQDGEEWSYCRNRQGLKMANDGGQGNHTWACSSMADWHGNRDAFERGRIIAYQNLPEFMYVAGDSTRAYAPRKCKLCLRQIVFVRPHTIVMLDRVVSTLPEQRKTWVMHCANQPQIAGPNVKIANGGGELFVQTLLPAGATIQAIHGYTYDGQDFPPAVQTLSAAWRIEVAPGEPACEDIFLHVMSTEAAPDAHLVQSAGAVGARGDGWAVLFESSGGGTVASGGQTQRFADEIVQGEYEW